MLGRRGSFWAGAAVAGLGLWASGAPSVLYPLYESEWGLSPTVSTLIFALYPIGLIPTLLIFGNLSDHFGRRGSILIGLLALGLGTLAFALAGNLTVVLIGRALMGIGVGFSSGPATAAMVEFGGKRRAQLASPVTAAATALGLALATLIGGALVQYAPFKLHLSFWVLLIVIVAVGIWTLFLPRSPTRRTNPWRPRLPHVSKGLHRIFVTGTLGISAAYGVGAVILALGADVAKDLIHSSNTLVTGSALSVSALAIGIVAIACRRVRPATALEIAPVAVVVGFGTLIASGAFHNTLLFFVASVIAGGGYALLFTGGLGLITLSTPEEQRGAVLAATYAVSYFVQAVVAIGLGVLASSVGLLLALTVGAIGLMLVAAAAALTVWVTQPASK
jgi:MFS family permease